MISLREVYDRANAARALVRSVRAEIRSLVRRVVVGKTTSAGGDTARCRGTTFGDTATEGEQLQQYGFASTPPKSAEGLYFERLGVMICCDHRTNRPALSGTEVAVWHDSGAAIFFRDDGSIALLPKSGQKVEIGGEPGAEFVALAQKVDTIISTLDTVFRGWVIPGSDGGAALKTAYLAAFATPPTSVAAQNVRAT